MTPPRCPRSLAALLLAGLAALALAPSPAHALKVATWNLIQYPQNNLAARQPHIRTVVAALDPDVIVLQELSSQAGRDSFLANVLNVVQPGQWAASNFQLGAEGAVFYKPAKITLSFNAVAIDINPTYAPSREVLAARLKFPGYASNLAEFRLYSVHFKAGTDPSDSTQRRQECTGLRNHLNTANLPVITPNLLVGGDTNFYGAFEGGYIRLTESQADNDGRLFDFYTLTGDWGQNAYRGHHSQSTCSFGDCPSGWSGGGLDDRFDFWMTSNVVQDGEGLDFVPGTYRVFGNDAQHWNGSVDGGGFNFDVGLTVATALRLASDHLPIMITIQAPARIAAESQLDFGRVLVGASAQRTLNVSNPATAPADELTYTIAAPAGYTAPGGTLTVNAGAAPNAHAITLGTGAPAVRNGTLSIASDAPDSVAKSVLLSGTVLAHASPSVDSSGIAHDAILDFGNHAPGGFADRSACVYNLGWNSLQSRYAMATATITGGGGRFSIAGGFSPQEIESSGCFTIHFDDTGAALDSTYVATLTFTGSDEALPGGVPAPDLTFSLRAHTGTTVSAPDARPAALAFLAPRPNPARGAVELGFELPRAARVSLALFDLGGRRVAGILDGERGPGRHAMRWTPVDDAGRPLEAGLYFVRFATPGLSATRRLVLLP